MIKSIAEKTCAKLLMSTIFITVNLFIANSVFAGEIHTDEQTVGLLGSHVLSSGGISDGKHIWTIPYEAGSFSKIDIKTGKAMDLSGYANIEKLDSLSGYRSGAYYVDQNGEQFIFLAPFDISKQLVRIDLQTLEIDYPVRNVGYYFGSCNIVSIDGTDYLWMFPSKTKPVSATSETEIVKINLSNCKKEAVIPAIIDKKTVAFSGSYTANEDIWLLPSEEGQPLVKMDARIGTRSLDADSIKKIYADKKFSFSNISTALFDGKCMWFVCENVSFMFNDSILVRTDCDGNFIDKMSLSRDHYVKSAIDNKFIYLFAGAEGMTPVNVKIDISTGEKSSFQITDKKGYIPAAVAVTTDDSENICIVPFTKDGIKKPIIKVVSAPKVNISTEIIDKLYRDFGDHSVGLALNVDFESPDGYTPTELYWFACNDTEMTSETKESFDYNYNTLENGDSDHENIKSIDKLTVFANKNGVYRFMAEFASDEDSTKHMYSFGSVVVDNIFDRLPIHVSRFDIENGDDNALIEQITYRKDFGAAFSYDGGDFIKTDPPMDMLPKETLVANDISWALASPNSHTISFGRGNISAENYCVALDLNYRCIKTVALDENDFTDENATISAFNKKNGQNNTNKEPVQNISGLSEGTGALLQSARNLTDVKTAATFNNQASESSADEPLVEEPGMYVNDDISDAEFDEYINTKRAEEIEDAKNLFRKSGILDLDFTN